LRGWSRGETIYSGDVSEEGSQQLEKGGTGGKKARGAILKKNNPAREETSRRGIRVQGG